MHHKQCFSELMGECRKNTNILCLESTPSSIVKQVSCTVMGFKKPNNHYNTRSTEKSPVRQQNAWFDRKKPGSTEKCPVRQKNALPSMHQLTLPLSNIPPSSEKYFFQFYSHIFKEPIEKWKWNYFDMNSKLEYSISFWKLKCNHSFLFVMAIMSTAINKCYRYGRTFCQFLHFLLIAPLKSDTHVRRA